MARATASPNAVRIPMRTCFSRVSDHPINFPFERLHARASLMFGEIYLRQTKDEYDSIVRQWPAVRIARKRKF